MVYKIFIVCLLFLMNLSCAKDKPSSLSSGGSGSGSGIGNGDTCGNIPGNLSTTNNYFGYVKLSWSAVAGAVRYNIRYRPPNGTFIYTSSTITSISIIGLTPATTYEWQVQTACSGGTSEYSSLAMFTTVCSNWFICLTQNIFTKVSYTSPSGTFPGAYGAAASSGSKVFFGGGHEEGPIGFVLDDVLAYDIISDSWNFLHLSVPRSHLSATDGGNKVIFAGGDNIASDNPIYGSATLEYYNRVDIFDNTTLLQTTGQLIEARGYMAVASSGNLAFFIGGKTIGGYSSKMDIYNTSTNSWSVIELPRQRAYAGAAVINTKIYIAGGKNTSGSLTVIDIYDISTGIWSTLQLPHEHPVASIVALNNKLIVSGGNGQTNSYVDMYNLSTSQWQSSQLSDSRYNMAVATANNKIIFFGGNYSSNIDMYDDITNSWSVTHLTENVAGMSTASVNGKCYFMGFLYGNINNSGIINTMMIIEP